MKTKPLLINVTVLFILSAILEMTLHEAGHFTAALLLQGDPVLFHNYVHYNSANLSAVDKIVFAAAGPVFSLVLGLAGSVLLYRGVRDVFARLFWWLYSVSAWIGFLGYLMISPFFSYGDTGYVLRALRVPMWGILGLAAGALAALYFVLVWLAPFPVSLMSGETASDPGSRRKFVLILIVMPLVIGIPVLTLLNLPAPTFLSLLAPLLSPWSLMYAYAYYLKGRPSADGYDMRERVAGRMPWLWFVLAAIVVLANRLLVQGFSVG